MPAESFQVRVCQNPDCGLRYPLLNHSRFGERCPICLGVTVVVAQGSLESEQVRKARQPATGPCLCGLVDNVRSAWNVGSIFRSAEGFGFEHLYLCGITPTPDNESVKKTALGAQDSVSWSSYRNSVQLIASLKERGCVIWVLEHTPQSVPIESAALALHSIRKCILVVGNEQVGVDPGILEIADRIVHLDMRGRKRSFNVAVAFAVAASVITHA
jgi:tRNA G18 (ribose-2'-O)-methylase SpoU